MPPANDESSDSTPHYNLTNSLSPFLDKHLLFPLLDFLALSKVHDADAVKQGKIDLLLTTNMIDYANDLHKELHGKEIADYKERRKAIIDRLLALRATCKPILDVLSQPDVVKRLRGNKDFHYEYLKENFAVTLESVQTLYTLARAEYECGQYAVAAEHLTHFRALAGAAEHEQVFQALWGVLSSLIMLQQWDKAIQTVGKLREAIEQRHGHMTSLEQLQQRSWLLHWALFVYFNADNTAHFHHKGAALSAMLELFLSEKYLNALQTTSPHLLRYVTAAVITSKRRKNTLADLVRILQQEGYTYGDPVTQFVESLYGSFNFEEAQKRLRECDAVLCNDFFLVRVRDDFIDQARHLVFETYCRIHERIDIKMLAEKLNMEHDAAERWIVNLMRNARLDARIDSADGHVVLGQKFPSVYQQIIEKTKGLTFRGYVLAANTDRHVQKVANKAR